MLGKGSVSPSVAVELHFDAGRGVRRRQGSQDAGPRVVHRETAQSFVTGRCFKLYESQQIESTADTVYFSIKV